MTRSILILLLAVLPFSSLSAQSNMLGRQSHNVGINSLPVKKEVNIDGDLSEWDLSGQIWSFADLDVRERFSVKTATMWDEKNLYLAFTWKDPMPMNSTIDPDFNPSKGWIADAIQLRILAGGQPSWITAWYYAMDKEAVCHFSYWKNPDKDKDGQEVLLLRSESGKTDLGKGVKVCYKANEAGDGFVQEMQIPWEMIYRKSYTGKAGDVFKMGIEYLWGDSTGNTWPIHRYADNMAPGHTSREFFWTAKKAWGEIKLLDKGNIEPRKYIAENSTLKGTIAVKAEIHADAKRFSIVIEDKDGNRIRNLAGDFDPIEYSQSVSNGIRTVKVMWDGVDDFGKMVQPGTYSVRGLTHKGLGASYQQSFYNPGTPPWDTSKGNGGWGADHAKPEYLAKAGDWMIIGYGFAEGGHGLFGVNSEGLKQWGEKRGCTALTADEKFLYAIPNDWHTKEQTLIRINAKNGRYAPFKRGGKELPLEYPFTEILGKDCPQVCALASADGKVLAALANGSVAIINAEDASLVKIVKTDFDMTGFKDHGKLRNKVLFAVDGKCEKLYFFKNSKLTELVISTGSSREITTQGLEKATAVTLDLEGNIVIADMGKDQQIKAFSATGKLLYTCGKKGGRPLSGKYMPEAVSSVSSVAVDSKGNVWVAECTDNPRRTSVWNRRGELVKDYTGTTGYAATGTFMHESDPNTVFCKQVKMSIKKDRSWKVEEITYVPDAAKGETLTLGEFGQYFYRETDGKKYEYAFEPSYRSWNGVVVLMRKGDRYLPVSAVGTVGFIAGEWDHHGNKLTRPLKKEFAHLSPWDGLIWNDFDKDGLVSLKECEIFPHNPKGRHLWDKITLPLGWGWSIKMDKEELSFFTKKGWKYTPVKFDADGAPIYGKAGLKQVNPDMKGDGFVPVKGEDTIVSMSMHDKYMYGYDKKTFKQTWQYPNPYAGVHGSHNATMPKRGLIIGTLKILGVAANCGEAGNVFVVRGNLGQDYYMTTDGVLVGALHPDCRLPGSSLPDKEEQLLGMPLEMFSQGGEPFNGWFGRHDDGVVRLTTGLGRQSGMIMQISGLEKIKRFKAPSISVDNKMIVEANLFNTKMKAESQLKMEVSVAKLTSNPDNGAWNRIKPLQMKTEGQPSTGEARLAWTDAALHLNFRIKDLSPWKNSGKEFNKLFKTGDCVDIQLSPSGNKGRDPKKGDCRVVIAQFKGKPVAVLMKPFVDNPIKEEGVNYHSPVGDKFFQQVKILESANVEVKVKGAEYEVKVSIPWASLGFKPQAGKTIRGDVGFILSDNDGNINTARIYWANKLTNLVNDLPLEAWLNPDRWGEITFE